MRVHGRHVGVGAVLALVCVAWGLAVQSTLRGDGERGQLLLRGCKLEARAISADGRRWLQVGCALGIKVLVPVPPRSHSTRPEHRRGA